MAPETKINLSNLPYDIIFDICDYLSNDDIQSLRLVSTAVSSNIPRPRLEEIQCQRTIFKHPREIARLKRLAALPLEKRNLIKHVVIDLADPYVVPLSSHEFDGLLRGYPGSTRLEMQKAFLEYRKRNPYGFRNKYTRPFRKLADKILQNSGLSRSSAPDQAEPDSGNESESSNLSFTTRTEIYSMLSETFDLNSGSQPLKFRRAKEKEEEGFDFYKSLIEAFKLLPNLKIITFKDRSRREQNKGYISTVWKAFNPTLAKFLRNNPEIESLPWHDWFQNSPDYGYGLTLSRAYPCVLFCAAHAQCQISEIRMDGLGWNGSIDSVPLWGFGRWYQSIEGLNFRPCIPSEGNDPTDVEAFQSTYKNLNRLEICIALDWMADYTDEGEASELFMTVIRNVQDLAVTRILDVHSESCKPSFVFPQMTVLPNLRSLEIIKAGITMKPLTEFLLANKGSLKEVFCVLTIRHTVKKEHMISFLEKVREGLDLRVFTMDFLTNKEPAKNCHLSVDIRGSWRDDTGGYHKYRVGTKCEQGRFWSWYSPRDREPLPRSNWVTKSSWNDFIEGIEEMATGESCLDHWNGNVKDHD
ncbi:hypothetical protein TWF718_008802 [Orbilia javanica]|uniref:F-box domain-containing protein n=1 Tax=Orbilia javanica TaxID=47235 RepID=A0AAN8RM14_9PEZI